MDFGPPELIIVVVLILVLFGGSQLPKLAKNLGKAQAEFKQALSSNDGSKDDGSSNDEATVAETAPSNADV